MSTKILPVLQPECDRLGILTEELVEITNLTTGMRQLFGIMARIAQFLSCPVFSGDEKFKSIQKEINRVQGLDDYSILYPVIVGPATALLEALSAQSSSSPDKFDDTTGTKIYECFATFSNILSSNAAELEKTTSSKLTRMASLVDKIWKDVMQLGKDLEKTAAGRLFTFDHSCINVLNQIRCGLSRLCRPCHGSVIQQRTRRSDCVICPGPPRSLPNAHATS